MPDTQSPQAFVDGFLAEFNSRAARLPAFFPGALDVRQCPTTETILGLPPAQLVPLVRAIVERQVKGINCHHGSLELKSLLAAVLRKKLPFTANELESLVRTISQVEHAGWWEAVSPATILRLVEQQAGAHGMHASLRDALELLAARLREHQYLYSQAHKLLQRVESLLLCAAAAPDDAGEAPASRAQPGVKLTTDEPWVKTLRDRLADLDETSRRRWDDLLTHCQGASASRPTGKWLKQAQALVAAIDDSFAEIVLAVLREIGKPGPVVNGPVNALGFAADPTQVRDVHSDLLRGLVWATGLVESEELTTGVGDAADVCFKKLPGIGPRAPKIGNACLWALSHISTETAVAQLARVKAKSKHASVQKQLGKALDAAAEKTGLSAEDLEEVAVPTFGLSAVGECRKPLGEFTALLCIREGRVELSWFRSDGKPQVNVPASLRERHAEEVKTLKKAQKDLEKQLPAQRARLERLLIQERNWSLADWRARFLDHPLVGTLARRLIWRLTQDQQAVDVVWQGDRLVDVRGQAAERLGESTRVALWHPIQASADEVRAWREQLEALGICQPFKQAHREIYLLTDAERRTEHYSNRFAAHILKQHQLAALGFERGWQYRLQGAWDSANSPTRWLPQFQLRAEFRVEAIEERGPWAERADLSHHMVYLYVTTDQIRFYQAESTVPMALTDVPPLAFSEVLRDIDLFVGVASVGNDPNWQDGGLLGRFGNYWNDYAVGELFPSAQTRKAVLEKIIPRLNIADRCSFTDRFLVVRGDLRTYYIHLGSGSVKMMPNDQYLCIVPDYKANQKAGKIYLPFEGDSMLSVILSKAQLLADDAGIKDAAIARQIALLQ